MRVLGASILWIATTAAFPSLAQLTPVFTTRTVEVEREYVAGLLPAGYDLQTFALLAPGFAYMHPPLLQLQTTSGASGGFDESHELVEGVSTSSGYKETVRTKATQVSDVSESGISIGGEIRCEPSVFFDDIGTLLIFSRCKAKTELDVTFTLDAPAHFDLSAMLEQAYSTFTMPSSVSLRTGAGALVAEFAPVDCVDVLPPFQIEFACAPTLQTISGDLPAGEYRLRVSIESAAATEDFYCDEYSGCWPGWTEYGRSTYQAELGFTPIALPGLGLWSRGAVGVLLGLAATVMISARPRRVARRS